MRTPLADVETPRLGKPDKAAAEVRVPSAPITATPDAKGSLLTEALFGERVQVLSEAAGFSEIVLETDHYRGFIASENLRPTGPPPTHRVVRKLSQIYAAPAVKARMIQSLPMGALVSQSGSEGSDKFLQTSDGFIPARHVVPVEVWQNDPLSVAMAWLDLPYLWGGRTALGVDCSALVQLAFAACGVALHRDSDLQWQTAGSLVGDNPDDACARGDLAFFPGHVGIMVDRTHVLHANATNMRVTIDSLTDVTEWVLGDLGPSADKPPFLGFRRIKI